MDERTQEVCAFEDGWKDDPEFPSAMPAALRRWLETADAAAMAKADAAIAYARGLLQETPTDAPSSVKVTEAQREAYAWIASEEATRRYRQLEVRAKAAQRWVDYLIGEAR